MNLFKSQDEVIKTIKKYRQKKYPFELSNYLTCRICDEILLDAIQTSCGCRYCRECIDTYLKAGNKKCLGDECDDVTVMISDKAINREISKLKVKCLFDGCVQQDALGVIGDHLDVCIHQPIHCHQCSGEFSKYNMNNHLLLTCPMRTVQCEFWGGSMSWQCNDISHQNECTSNQTRCSLNIGGVGSISVEIENKNKESLSLSNDVIDELRELRIKTSIMKRDFAELNKAYQNQMTKLESQMIEIDRVLKVNTLKEIRDKSTKDTTIYSNGIYIWKIRHFSSLKTSAETGKTTFLSSVPFYTKEFGYKMCMTIYPAGVGMGKGNYLSVFITLLKGEYDDILTWPFRKKIHLFILDQINKTRDHSQTFKPDSKSRCCQQPTEEENIISGSSTFITFTELFGRFIRNDTLFLKMVVLV